MCSTGLCLRWLTKNPTNLIGFHSGTWTRDSLNRNRNVQDILPLIILFYKNADILLFIGSDTLYFMEQSPSWEANRFSASQNIPRILWNPNVHYRIHKCPPPVPILSQIDPVHDQPSHFLNIHFNITLTSTPRTPKWSLFLRFPHQNPLYASPPYVLHSPTT